MMTKCGFFKTFLSRKTSIGFCLSMIAFSSLNAQEIRSEADRKEIKIGEQIQYKISVETSAGENVVFPDGQTFMPLEMVRSTDTDTLRENGKFRLEKEYFLTQFDSGSYTIPRQRIIVNSKDFFTEPIDVEVRTLAVDTLTRPLFDIKPIVEVDAPKNANLWLWVGVILAVIALIALLLYFFIFRNKKLTPEEIRKKLPPFERAIEDLKKLQNSKYLIESKHKEYYSELTDIIREYLEDEVHILAKESTTDELLTKIHLLQESGKLNLSLETIQNLKRVLQTADLVKFAKDKPEDKVAESDRKTLESVVIETRKALPEVGEEPSIDLEELIKKSKKKTRRKALIVTSVVFSLCVLSVGSIAFLQFRAIENLLFSSSYLKKLNQSEWITSDYGYPMTEIATPDVLKRRQLIEIKGLNASIDKQYVFDFGSINSELFIMTSVLTFKQPTDGKQIDLDPSLVNEIVLSQLETSGAQNITTFVDEYTSSNGAKGMKVHGTMSLINKQSGKPFNAVYELYSFTENGALQQLLITYLDDPTGKEIAEKIVHSLNFKID